MYANDIHVIPHKGQITEMESLIVNWSTHFHCTITHITKCLLEHYKAISSEWSILNITLLPTYKFCKFTPGKFS